MSDVYEYKRTRSQFWLKIFDNDDSITISSNSMVKYLIDAFFPGLKTQSPKGWVPSRNIDNIHNLWIPGDRIDYEYLNSMQDWAEQANQHIWLTTNRNTRPFFMGNEVDFCIAADWNFDVDTHERTEIGEAEYGLKYLLPRNEITTYQVAQYTDTLKAAIIACIDLLPLNTENLVVTTIPAAQNKQNKLSWQLAQFAAKVLDVPFIGITLINGKPQMKEQNVEDKIMLWRTIFNNTQNMVVPQWIYNKNILVVDDLYQSGASLWCFAEFLKNKCNAYSVMATTSVKALKDGDNL